MLFNLKGLALDLIARAVLRVGAITKRGSRLERDGEAVRLVMGEDEFVVTFMDDYTLLVETNRFSSRSTIAESYMEYFAQVTRDKFLLWPAADETAEGHRARLYIIPNPDAPPRALPGLRKAARWLWRAEMWAWNGAA